MFAKLKLAALVALVCINHMSMIKTASAISAELAKTCQALTERLIFGWNFEKKTARHCLAFCALCGFSESVPKTI
jgi:hypothetical protein